MRILLTNDDGIYAPGLRALRPELQKLGEVTVVAPASEQSAVGHSVTLLTPLMVQEVCDEQNQLAGLGGRGPAGRLRQAGAAGAAAGAAGPGRQRPQRRLQRRHQRPLLRHRGRRHRGGVLPLHQHRRVAGVHQAQAARLPARRRPGPPRHRADPRPPAGRRHAVQRQHSRAWKGARSAASASCRRTWRPTLETYDRRIDPRGRVYFWTNPEFGCPDPHPDTRRHARWPRATSP